MAKFNRPIADGYKNLAKRKRVMKQMRKKNRGVKIIPVADPELITKHIMRKRNSNPRANVTLSGKKKNKILKQLRHAENDKLKMEVADEQTKVPKKTKKSRPGAKKAITNQSDDVEMKET